MMDNGRLKNVRKFEELDVLAAFLRHLDPTQSQAEAASSPRWKRGSIGEDAWVLNPLAPFHCASD
jgi:hypothetical protein